MRAGVMRQVDARVPPLLGAEFPVAHYVDGLWQLECLLLYCDTPVDPEPHAIAGGNVMIEPRGIVFGAYLTNFLHRDLQLSSRSAQN